MIATSLRTFPIAFFFVLTTSCVTSALPDKSSPSANASVDGAAKPDPMAKSFGAPVPAGEAVALSDLQASFATYDGQPVLTEARIEKVCLKKGCWMTLGEADGSARVVFKNYGFFVPGEIAGKTVRLLGVLERKELSEAQARHFLADGGAPKEEIEAVKGPQQAWHFVAEGVEVL